MQRFGNTIKDTMRTLFVGIVAGVIAYVFSAFMLTFKEHRPISVLFPLLFIIILPPVAIFIGVLPTLLFSLYVSNEWIEHRFLNRFVVSRAKVTDLTQIAAPSGTFAAVLHFSGGRRIRFYGARYSVINALIARLNTQKTKGADGKSPEAAQPPY